MPSPLRPARELLIQYAEYHRDRRNIATHFIGIPLIVYALAILLSHPAWTWGDLKVTPILLVWVASTVWYLTRGELLLGVLTSAANAVLIAAAQPLAALPDGQWLAWGVGLFVVGWVFQFIGHRYEGRKPAFLDDLVGLLVGPLFVVMEAMFAVGWNPALQAAITAQAGPTRGGAGPAHG